MLQNRTLDKTTPVPLYYQLKTLILDEINSGEYKPDDMLPTELELGEMFNISRTTVRQAITELTHDGYLYRIKSKGTFVSAPKIQHTFLPSEPTYYNTHTFDEDIIRSGRSPRSEILELGVRDAPKEMLQAGYSSESGKAVFVYRRRYADDIAFARIRTYLNYERFSFLLTSGDLEKYAINEIMNRNPETVVSKLVRTFTAATASLEDINILGVERNTAIQQIQNIRYNLHGEVLDISYAYNRGDFYSMKVETILNPAYDGK